MVCHVIPDVMRHHSLSPTRGENDVVLGAELSKRAADLVVEQVGHVLRLSPDDYRVVIETGAPAEEIVRLAEAESASLIALGAKPRDGVRRVLGHVAERVVRYAHAPVLVARSGQSSGKVLVATDFSEGALPALRLAEELARSLGVETTLLHVMQPPLTALSSVMGPLGGVWTPPSKSALDQLETLGKSTLEGLAKQYGFTRFEQLTGEPGNVIPQRAHELGVEMILMGSRGRTGLARLVLGSVAEQVIRESHCSVLVVRKA